MLDPIKGVLPEQFFLDASPECLSALAKLMDDALARRLIQYLESTVSDNPVAVKINKYLGDAILDTTFHITLQERESVQLIEKIDLQSLSKAPIDRAQVVKELQFLEDNFSHIYAYLEPRKLEDFEAFINLCPLTYVRNINVNKSLFYQPRAKRRYTGVGAIIRKHREWSIALKGLKFLEYYTRLPIGANTQFMKEF